ncbi:MAG: carbon-nitrogen hydrolase family protein [Lachnospiraceae bacterium]
MQDGIIQLGLIQMNTTQDVEANLQTAARLAATAVSRGAQLLVFPERVNYIGPNVWEHAQESHGRLTGFFAALAAEHQVYVHCGSLTQRAAGGKTDNVSQLFSPAGELLASYHKLHMFDVDIDGGLRHRESDTTGGGTQIVVAHTKLADIGFAICYDLRFPELFRLLTDAGARLIILPADFTKKTGEAHWETLLRARAIENGCFVAACGQIGDKKIVEAYGHSMVIDPWGSVLGSLKEQEDCLIVPVDLSQTETVRNQIPSLKNRRKDIYQLSSDFIKEYNE